MLPVRQSDYQAVGLAIGSRIKEVNKSLTDLTVCFCMVNLFQPFNMRFLQMVKIWKGSNYLQSGLKKTNLGYS